MYFINGKEILLEKGDRLYINKGVKHRAIGLTPKNNFIIRYILWLVLKR